MESDRVVRVVKSAAMETLGLQKSAYHKYLKECDVEHFRAEDNELYLLKSDLEKVREHIASKRGTPVVTVVNDIHEELETAITPMTIPANWQEILEEAIALKVAESDRESLVKEVASQLTEEDIPPELREKKKEETAIAILNLHRKRQTVLA